MTNSKVLNSDLDYSATSIIRTIDYPYIDYPNNIPMITV